MDLAKLMKIQISADEKRGFAVKFDGDRERVRQLTKDLVGLFGEVGEFSNILKKVDIKLDRPAYNGATLSESRSQLGEELADILIYLIRLAATLEIDLETGLVKKIKINQERYKSLERD